MLLSDNLLIGELLSIGNFTTIIGLLITFIALVLLVITLNFMKKVYNMNNVKVIEEQRKVGMVPDENLDIIATADDSSIVAAIIAAISVILSGEKKLTNKARAGFIVKSIKRI